MKKVSFLFAALLVSALVLSSCGSGSSTEVKDSAAADSQPQVEAPVDTPAPADSI